MLYRIMKRLIENGRTMGLREKLDVFFAVGSVTETEYHELLDMLQPKEA